MMGMKIMPYVVAIVAVLFWASAFPAVKYALDYFSPEGLMLFRFLIASAALLGYCAVKRVPFPRIRDLPLFILSGATGIFLYMWAFNTGTDMVAAGISGFIIASAPVFTLVMSIILLKERVGARVWFGVLLSFGGIVLISATQLDQGDGFRLNLGIWLLLGAAICTSFYNIFQKRLLYKYSPIQASAYSVAFGTLFTLVFIPNMIRDLPGATPMANAVLIYLGLFPAALAYFLWGYSLSKAEKTIYVTSFLYLSPFLASVIAYFWLGEVIPPLAYVGGAVIVVGMIITNAAKRAKN